MERKDGLDVTKIGKTTVTEIEQTVTDSIRDFEKIVGFEKVVGCLLMIPKLKEERLKNDMICFDFLLLTRSHFFQHYFPEVDQVEAYHKYGYNLKSQIIRIIVYPFICALIAWICTMI